MIRSLFLLALSLLLGCQPAATPDVDSAGAPARTVPVVHRDGRRLLGPDGATLHLRGVAFGNEIWSNAPIPPTTHHDERDYARVRDMGMNAIRFYLNYTFFEDDARPYVYKQTGWAWLDQNVAWAKKHGIYLILNMHAPQGGYQSQGKGGALWDVPENGKRLTALWAAIARRYATEPAIAGYDLVNEPVTTQSIQQWQTLAQQLIDAIRAVDRNHLIVVERLNGIGSEWRDFNGENNLFLVRDDNVMYQFHTYEPFLYTHQLFDWAKTGDGGRYPDPDQYSFPAQTSWYGTHTAPALTGGSTAWRYVESSPVRIADPKQKIAMPVCEAARLGAGTVFVDAVQVKEFDPNGQFTRVVATSAADDQTGWYFWAQNNVGNWRLASEGYSNGKSIAVSGTTDNANVGCWAQKFVPKQGYSYQVTGWLKGDNLPATASARLRLDFETTDSPIYARDKPYMASVLQPFIDWGRKNNVPMFMGEFGAGAPCFRQDKGGVQWVSDVLDIALANDLHLTYHAYHEDSFGIYPGYGRLPVETEGNGPLIGLFKAKLR